MQSFKDGDYLTQINLVLCTYNLIQTSNWRAGYGLYPPSKNDSSRSRDQDQLAPRW